MQALHHIFPPLLQGNFDKDSADNMIDGMDDVLSDCMAEESNDVQTKWNFPRSWGLSL